MTNLFITIDTEFSAGGYFHKDTLYSSAVTEEAVYCKVDGVSHGLGFLLNTFEKHAIKATFFVEAAHTFELGFDVMKSAIDAIAQAGHDIQLHIHPMWHAETRCINGADTINDSMAALDEVQSLIVLEQGLEAFHQWGLPKPYAFRAGNLLMAKPAYRALNKLGICVSSSIGMSINMPSEEELRIANGRTLYEGVVEVPVFSYAAVNFSNAATNKCLTITGVGADECNDVLSKAVSSDVEDVVVLTHPFEFVKRKDIRYQQLTKNRVNQSRLNRLCNRAAQSSTVQPATFSEHVERWRRNPSAPASHVRASNIKAISRMIENKLNDTLWNF